MLHPAGGGQNTAVVGVGLEVLRVFGIRALGGTFLPLDGPLLPPAGGDQNASPLHMELNLPLLGA